MEKGKRVIKSHFWDLTKTKMNNIFKGCNKVVLIFESLEVVHKNIEYLLALFVKKATRRGDQGYQKFLKNKTNERKVLM